ncbi:nucleotidyltransferase family protein [Rippkaea orientalis]|nr:nucleotidyltransferase domain-containing protein [Rippkaea orientalis]
MTPITQEKRSEIIESVQQARSKRTEFLAMMKQRQEKGLEIAKKSADLLKQKFGVKRVVLFGSMLNPEEISPHSDIDLAVWGLPSHAIFKAGAAIERGHEFNIDLVEASSAKPHIRQAIEQGIEL